MFRRAKDIGILMVLISVLVLFNLVFFLQSAEAVAQWSRKYKTGCSTCHTVFPRLNYYGERFMKNGYQDPDDARADGNKMKKKINDNLVIDRVSNLLGFRLNLTPIQAKEDGITIEGDKKTQITIGDANWIQFFVAGSIFKNVSFFTEMQFEDKDYHFSWWHLGLHNILETTAINFTAGNVSPIDFSSHSNRLRIFAPIKNSVYSTNSANGTGDDSISISGSRPGIQYYGYYGPATWWTGLSPGSNAADVNDRRNYWGGAKLEITEAMESQFEGSSVSFWGIAGMDVTNDDSVTPRIYRKSDNERYQAAVNLRWKKVDVQTAYVWGEDDDWDLTTAAKDKAKFGGVALQAAYLYGKWYPAISYDNVDYKDASATKGDVHTITPAISYLLRENMRLGFYATFDINDDTGHDKQNTYLVNIRTMF